MPIYEYVCESCAGRFQAMRRMSERAEPVECKVCGSGHTALALSVPARVGVTADVAPSSCARNMPGCGGGGCMN